jgi:hypothetical protein
MILEILGELVSYSIFDFLFADKKERQNWPSWAKKVQASIRYGFLVILLIIISYMLLPD